MYKGDVKLKNNKLATFILSLTLVLNTGITTYATTKAKTTTSNQTKTYQTTFNGQNTKAITYNNQIYLPLDWLCKTLNLNKLINQGKKTIVLKSSIDLTALKKQIDTLTSDNTTLQNTIDANTKTINDSNTTIKDLQNQISTLKNDSATKDSTIAQLQSQITKLTTDCNNKDSQIKDLQNKQAANTSNSSATATNVDSISIKNKLQSDYSTFGGVTVNFSSVSINSSTIGGAKSEVGIICDMDIQNKVKWNSLSSDDKVNWLKSVDKYLSSTLPYPEYTYFLDVIYQDTYSDYPSGYDSSEISVTSSGDFRVTSSVATSDNWNNKFTYDLK